MRTYLVGLGMTLMLCVPTVRVRGQQVPGTDSLQFKLPFSRSGILMYNGNRLPGRKVSALLAPYPEARGHLQKARTAWVASPLTAYAGTVILVLSATAIGNNQSNTLAYVGVGTGVALASISFHLDGRATNHARAAAKAYNSRQE